MKKRKRKEKNGQNIYNCENTSAQTHQIISKHFQTFWVDREN